MPLPSALSTSSTSHVHGIGTRWAQKPSISAAAACTSSSICRLPATRPHRRSITALAVPEEPRTASHTARRRSPWLCRLAGSDSAVSAG